jgi:hypothetical protein
MLASLQYCRPARTLRLRITRKDRPRKPIVLRGRGCRTQCLINSRRDGLGPVVGGKRSNTVPSAPMRNLVKFHLSHSLAGRRLFSSSTNRQRMSARPVHIDLGEQRTHCAPRCYGSPHPTHENATAQVGQGGQAAIFRGRLLFPLTPSFTRFTGTCFWEPGLQPRPIDRSSSARFTEASVEIRLLWAGRA